MSIDTTPPSPISENNRAWEVTFTARRKVTRYQHQEVIVTVTETEFVAAFGHLAAPNCTPEMEQIAAEKGETLIDNALWSEGEEHDEPLDPGNFEIIEIKAGETRSLSGCQQSCWP